MTRPGSMAHELETIAQSIGHGHAYKKHVLRKKEFADPKLGLKVKVDSEKAFAKHILKVMTDPRTRVFKGARDKVYFYNFTSNTAIAYDPAHKDLGSCWRATAGVEEVRRLVVQDQDTRALGQPGSTQTPVRARIYAGGIGGLPPDDASVPRSSFATPHIRPADPEAPRVNRFLVPRHRQG